MRLVVVGSGTAAPTPDRVCSGYWVHAGDQQLLLDCGPGVVHRFAQLRLPWQELDHLLVSHFHTDHTGDIPMLLFALKHGVRPAREKPLTIWGPRGIRDRLAAMEAAFGAHVADPGFPVTVREVEPGAHYDAGGPLVAVARTPHTEQSVAYRVEHGGATLGYTGDTGPGAEVADFMHGCSVLIAECSLPDDQGIPTHLTPSTLAELADRAGPDRIVVTHVYPQLDPDRCVDRLRGSGWTGQAIVARDGLELDVGLSG